MARRRGISPQHLFVWRKAARSGVLSLPADDAPLFVGAAWRWAGHGSGGTSPTMISIEIGGAVVRVAVGVGPAWLRDVLRP